MAPSLKAVWSFWTKPYRAGRQSSWAHDWYHWLAWGLSVYAARQHYPDTCLVTDDEGARVLVDRLQLPFVHVSTALNTLADEDPAWWALGKIEAYRLQQEPFVHIDTDVFLWRPLSPHLAAADVFAQNPEPIFPGASCYQPEELEGCLRYPDAGWLPTEWEWYRRAATSWRAECCGVFGGCRIDFIRHYAGNALRLVTDTHNRTALRAFPQKARHMILVEQYLLSACIEYHRNRKNSPFHGVEVRYVFDTITDAFQLERATEAGFTHLAAGAKQNPRLCQHLEIRVQQELPGYYERCRRFVLPYW